MKFFTKLFTVVLVLGSLGLLSGQITGSAHDFSGATWNSGTNICIVCHTPHNASTNPDAPLWNHDETVAAFTIYSSTTLDAVPGQPSGSSKLCLSCHDGTVALENFGGATGGTNFVTGGDLLGTDLSNDHPISFTYDAALAGTDGTLHDPTTTLSGLGLNIDDDMLSGGTMMECSSCHDVHNDAGIAMLLKKTNAASALCLTCHNK